MYLDLKGYVFCTIIVVTMIALFVEGIIFMDASQCRAKASALGYNCSYSFMTGCVLEKPDGKKLLLEQLRDYNE